MMLGLCSTQLWLTQIPAAPTVSPVANTPEQVALIFSGSQFFIALVAGVLMAFAFQFLLTNFTVAAGISSGENPADTDSDDSWGHAVREVESKVGLWALLTVNIALFIACFLAVKLTLINSVMLGAITGVVIWSAYFLLLLWVQSCDRSLIVTFCKTSTVRRLWI
jgi:hypothetical protein